MVFIEILSFLTNEINVQEEEIAKKSKNSNKFKKFWKFNFGNLNSYTLQSSRPPYVQDKAKFKKVSISCLNFLTQPQKDLLEGRINGKERADPNFFLSTSSSSFLPSGGSFQAWSKNHVNIILFTLIFFFLHIPSILS